jgi:hypothetical protein
MNFKGGKNNSSKVMSSHSTDNSSTSVKKSSNNEWLSNDLYSTQDSYFTQDNYFTQDKYLTQDNYSSNNIFISSDDILGVLREHRHFRVKADRIKGILALIVSGAALAGGAAIILISGGAATPGVVLGTALLTSTGIVGMQNAIGGVVNRNFKWSGWGTEIIFNAAVTILTFGAGYVVGNVTGIALRGCATARQVRALSTIAGALAGAGVRTGSYVVISKIRGEPIQAFSLVLEGVVGALTGANAGLLGGKTTIINYNNAMANYKDVLTPMENGNHIEGGSETISVKLYPDSKEALVDMSTTETACSQSASFNGEFVKPDMFEKSKIVNIVRDRADRVLPFSAFSRRTIMARDTPGVCRPVGSTRNSRDTPGVRQPVENTPNSRTMEIEEEEEEEEGEEEEAEVSRVANNDIRSQISSPSDRYHKIRKKNRQKNMPRYVGFLRGSRNELGEVY